MRVIAVVSIVPHDKDLQTNMQHVSFAQKQAVTSSQQYKANEFDTTEKNK